MKKYFDVFKSTKIGKKAFENRYILLSFLCSILLSVLIAFCFDLTPFGEKIILRMDLYHQYGPLFAELYERIKGNGGFLYSWCSGGGSSFLGNFFNYLSSPLSICVLAFGHKNIPEAIAFMIFAKACFSSVTFSLYLKKTQGISNYVTSAFGVLYAFSGYFIAYYWNLMWLDAMVLLPIVLYGVEKIINKGKPLVYIFSLAITVFANYYMGYMVCIFSAIYFLFYYYSKYCTSQQLTDFHTPFEKNKANKNLLLEKILNSRLINSGLIFIFSSLLAAGLVAFCLLSTYYVLKSCSATSGTFPEKLELYNNVFDFIVNHFADLTPTIRSSGESVLPNVYCSVLTVILIPLFYFAKSISLREKISYTCVLAVMFLSFNINFLNYIWHGLHFPNDLPYRFSFMYTFIILVMGYKAIKRIKEIKPNIILGITMGVLAFLFVAQKVGSKNLDDNTVYISAAFAIIYSVVLYLFTTKKYALKVVSLFVLCAVVSEYAIASTDNYVMNQTKSSYVDDLASFNEIKSKLDAKEGTPYYRMELTELRTRMDPCWYCYNGVSTFTSMAYEKLANLQQNLGMAGNYINSYTYNLQTPIYNAMFGIKYIVNNDSSQQMNEDFYTQTAKNKTFDAYQNKYFLPIAFSVKDYMSDWDTGVINPFDVQNQFFALASGVGNALERVPISDLVVNNLDEIPFDEYTDYFYYQKKDADLSADVTAFIKADETANYYVYVESGGIKDLDITVGDRSFSKNIGDEEFIVDIGKCEKDTFFTVSMLIDDESESNGASFYVYRLNEKNFKKGYEYLKKGQMNITKFTDTQISGSVNIDDGFLYTSIPFDKSWSVTVDGKNVDSKNIIIVGNALLGVRMENGKHDVTFKFTPRGLKNGTIISVLSAFILIILILISKKYRIFDFYFIMFDANTNKKLAAKKKSINIMQLEIIDEKEKYRSEYVTNFVPCDKEETYFDENNNLQDDDKSE